MTPGVTTSYPSIPRQCVCGESLVDRAIWCPDGDDYLIKHRCGAVYRATVTMPMLANHRHIDIALETPPSSDGANESLIDVKETA